MLEADCGDAGSQAGGFAVESRWTGVRQMKMGGRAEVLQEKIRCGGAGSERRQWQEANPLAVPSD